MGFLDTLHTRGTWSGPYSLKDPALARLFGSGYEASSGIVVTEANAMTFSAVFSAVLQLSGDTAKPPLNHHKRLKDGGSEHYFDSRLYYLLKERPNPETSSMMFRQTLTAHALTCHGGYAEIERDMHGLPKALWILTPDRVEPLRRDQHDRATGRKMLGPLEYRIDNDDDQILPARDVIHISGLGYDGITGYSVINKARQAIGLALAMEKFGGQYFGKGTVFGGWLETDSDLDEPQKKDIKENIEAFRKAQDSAWRILVTGAGHKFHQFESDPNKSQMDESRTAQILEVARFFRMPPVKLGVNTPGTVSYASSEQADLDYYKGGLSDWITRWEQELNPKLIPATERRQQFIKHNLNSFLRADTAARTAYYEKMLTHGVFCADDVLDLEDRNPQPNGQGKLYLVQGAMIAKDQLVKLTDAKIKKINQPKPAPAAPAADPAAVDDDQARAIVALGEQMAQIGVSVAGMAGDQQARLVTMRDELETLRTDKTAADSALASATRAAEALTAERDAAVTCATAAEAAAAAATTDRDAMGAAAAQARAEATGASLAATEAEAARQAAIADLAASGELLTDLQQRFEALTGELTETRTTLQQAEATAATAAEAHLAAQAAAAAARAAEVAEITTARDQAATEAETLRGQLAALGTSQASERATLDASIATAEQAHAALQARVAELEATATEAGAAALRAQQHLDGERSARIERMTVMIAAHRGLIVDAIGRMARREAQQARAKQTTPEKLRRWLDGVASVEAPICREAFLPAIRVRLAAAASTEDPIAVTDALVTEHLQAFEALIRGVLTAAPEDFHAELDRVLTRWETERAERVADALLENEVRHVRSL